MRRLCQAVLGIALTLLVGSPVTTTTAAAAGPGTIDGLYSGTGKIVAGVETNMVVVDARAASTPPWPPGARPRTEPASASVSTATKEIELRRLR